MFLPRTLILVVLVLTIAGACSGGQSEEGTRATPMDSLAPTTPVDEIGSSSQPIEQSSALPTSLASPAESNEPEGNANADSPIGTLVTLLLTLFGLAAIAAIFVLAWLGVKHFTNFRTTIEEKEWIIAPASQIDESRQASIALQERVVKLTSEIMLLAEALADRREHLEILTTSLAERDEQIKTSSIGVEQHARVRSLRYVAQIAEIMEVDRRAGIEPNKTIIGLKSEVEHILEEAGVAVYEPQVGDTLPQRGVSLKRVKTIPAPSPELAGTIKSIEAPAYILVGPNEQEVVLQPMAITVYSSNQEEGK